MATCRDCFHWEACKAMFEASGGITVADDFKGSDVRCKNFLSAADVAPRAEVEKLQEVNADLNESLRLASEANKDLQVELQAMRGAANSYKMHYESLAMEIFEELDKKIFHKIPDLYTLEIYKELKKKYTEATP